MKLSLEASHCYRCEQPTSIPTKMATEHVRNVLTSYARQSVKVTNVLRSQYGGKIEDFERDEVIMIRCLYEGFGHLQFIESNEGLTHKQDLTEDELKLRVTMNRYKKKARDALYYFKKKIFPEPIIQENLIVQASVTQEQVNLASVTLILKRDLLCSN